MNLVFSICLVMFVVSIVTTGIAVKRNLTFHARVQLLSAVAFIVGMYLA